MVPAMTVQEMAQSKEYRDIVKEYRDTCLWFASDKVNEPQDLRQIEMVLSSIEANGDMEAYKRVGKIHKWL